MNTLQTTPPINTATQFAVYGKGGIGKSTVSAHLSAALASRGKKVLQIGCDPKHDSTRLLLGGSKIPTVLDHLRDVPKEQADVSAILHEGWAGIGCIEAGGPKPGVGCAGRGIISAFEFLNDNHIKENYDCIIYDVLGDVVCGGFAVPVRREYADAILLVTSGEFMSVYAANNILRGINKYDGDLYKRVGGIIFNKRNIPGETDSVRRFSEAVRLPVIATIPRSEAFARAEEKNLPLEALEDFPEERQIFEELAEKMVKGLALYPARPLSDEDLEAAVLHGISVNSMMDGAMAADRKSPAEHISGTEQEPGADHLPGTEQKPGTDHMLGSQQNPGADRNQDSRAPSEDYTSPRPKRPPLYGCAFNGAATTAVCVRDAVIIAHSPRCCAFYTWQNISSPGRKNLFNRGILMPSALSPNFICTDMTQSEAVYGGTEKLFDCVRKAVAKRPGAVIVISSCVSGIIGDDVLSAEELSTPEVPVIVIPADGVINGDYMTGIQTALKAIARRLIIRDPEIKTRTVNIIGEVSVSNNLEADHKMIKDLLARMDIGINCRFLGEAKVSDLRNFMQAPINILAHESADNLALKEWLIKEYGCVFLDMPLPTGFAKTCEFTEKISEFFSCREKTVTILEEEKANYLKNIDRLREKLSGKRILLTTISTDMDWLLSAALDVGVVPVWVGVADYLHQGIHVSRIESVRQVTEAITDINMVDQKIRELKPDIVVANYISTMDSDEYVCDRLPMTLPQGFSSGIIALERWVSLLEKARQGEWVHDRELFQKYLT